MNRPRILIADDHAILLDAFKKLLETDYDVVGTVTDGQALVKAAEQLKPDVILADISMPRLNGLDAGERLRERAPDAKLLYLTVNEDPDIAAEAIRRGAAGFLLKKCASAELFQAIRHVLAGQTYISPSITKLPAAVFVGEAKRRERPSGLSLRQREVLQLLAEGKSMKEAAGILGVAPRTIAFHKYAMMEQLGLKTSAELVQYAVTLGLIAGRTPPTA
jgi:DNA-binding NarL/FixJ family response regulator